MKECLSLVCRREGEEPSAQMFTGRAGVVLCCATWFYLLYLWNVSDLQSSSVDVINDAFCMAKYLKSLVTPVQIEMLAHTFTLDGSFII